MKINIFAFMSVFIMQLPVAHAYRMIIFTDQSDPQKALSVIDEFRSTYPFNKFEIEFQVARAKPEQLKCKSDPRAKRMVTCRDVTKSVDAITQKMGGDQALIIKDFDFHGGAAHVGFGTPVMTVGAAKSTMIHEYLHTLGLCDEYAYEAALANNYCQRGAKAEPNKAYINPLSSYANDGDARSRHQSSIMWFQDILPSTLITNTKGRYLGTEKKGKSLLAPINSTTMETKIDMPTGLYPSDVCKNATTGVKTWRPGGSTSIMESLNAGLGKPLEKIVERMLIAKGMRLKPEFRNNNYPTAGLPPAVEDSNRGSQRKESWSYPAPKTKQDSRGVAK